MNALKSSPRDGITAETQPKHLAETSAPMMPNVPDAIQLQYVKKAAQFWWVKEGGIFLSNIPGVFVPREGIEIGANDQQPY